MTALRNYLYLLLIACVTFGFSLRIAAEPINNPAQTLKYTIHYEQNVQHPTLDVTLEFTGDETGHTVMILPSAIAEAGGLYKNIHNIVATGATLKKTSDPNIYALHYLPGSNIVIRYQVRQGGNGQLVSYGQFRAPIIQNTYFQFKGEGVFIYPESHMDDQPVTFSLDWNMPAGWPLANSFGANNLHQQFTTSIVDLLQSLFLAGDYHLYQTNTHGGTIWTAIRGKWSFSDQQYNAAAVKLLTTERDFWHEYHFPNYLVSLIPMGTACNSIGGTGLNNSFASFMGPDCTLNNDALFLITHENFHTWNRPYIFKNVTEDNDKYFYWFTEGFTNYYGHLLTLRAGLISIQDYVDQYNKTLVNYYFSPVVAMPIQEVQENYWKDYYIQMLPYQQGEILAQNWNARIKHATQGQKSLDNLMRGIINSAVPQQSEIDKVKLKQFLQQFMPEDLSADVNEVYTGKIIQPAADSMGPCYRLEMKMLAPYKAGFDVDTSKKLGVITSVNPTGHAYAAGLRDGQKLIAVQENTNDINQPITVTFENNAVKTTVRYLPYMAKPKLVPQFIKDDKAWRDNPTACNDWFGVS